MKDNTGPSAEVEMGRPPPETADDETLHDGDDMEVNLLSELMTQRKALLYMLLFGFGILLDGYNLNIIGSVTALRGFQYRYGERYHGRYIIPSKWLSVWQAAGPIGELGGTLVSGALQERAGRRTSLATGTFVTSIGVAISLISKLPSAIGGRRAVFLVAKLIEGFGISVVIVTCLTYISEVAPVRLRGPALALVPMITTIGQLVGTGVVRSESSGKQDDAAFMVPLATQLAFSVAAGIAALLAPESPAWLVRKGRLPDAQRALERLSPVSDDPKELVHQLQAVIQRESQNTASRPASLLECLSGKEIRRTVLALMAYASPQFWGYTLVASSSYLLEVLGLNPTQALTILLLTNSLGVLATAGSFWTTTYFGRRTLLLASYTFNGTLWLIIGIINCFPSVTMAWVTGSLIILIMISSCLAALPVFYTVGGEASSLRLRSRTLGLGWFCGAISSGTFGIVWPYIYNLDAGDLRGKIGFILAGLCLIAVTVIFLVVPEMRGRSAREIDVLFEKRVPARQFKHHVVRGNEVFRSTS